MSNEHQTFSQFYLISWSNTDYFCLFLQQLFGVSLKIDGRYRKHGDLLRDGFHFHLYSFTLLLKHVGGVRAIQPTRGNVSFCHPASTFPIFISFQPHPQLGGKKVGQGERLGCTLPASSLRGELGCLRLSLQSQKVPDVELNPGQSIACGNR